MSTRKHNSGKSCTPKSEYMETNACSSVDVSTAPVFFHTIDELELTTLRIPAAFVKQHLDNVDGEVCITTTDMKSWKVKLVTYVLGKKFGDGWLALMLHYKTKPADVLVLFYVGASQFVIRILDGTTKMDKQVGAVATGGRTSSTSGLKEETDSGKYRVKSNWHTPESCVHPLTGLIEENDPPKYRGDWQTFSVLRPDHWENGLVLDLEWGRQNLQLGNNQRILRYRDYVNGPPAHFYKVNCVLEHNLCAIREGWTDFADFYDLNEKDLFAINYVFDDGVTWDIEFYHLNL